MLDYMVSILAAILASHVSPEQLAVDKIIAYAQSSTNSAPTVIDYHNAGILDVTADNLSEMNYLVDSLEGSDVDSEAERLALVPLLTLELVPLEDIEKVEYFAPFSVASEIVYGGSQKVHYYVESNTSEHIELNVTDAGVINIAALNLASSTGESRVNLIAFTNSQAQSRNFIFHVSPATFTEFSPLAFTMISDEVWDETAVRKVLNTFAYGGHASDIQIKTWADMLPRYAIVQMLTFDAHNNYLSPIQNILPQTSSLETLARFWSSDDANNTLNSEYRSYFDIDSWSAPSNAWMLGVMMRGLNPFLSRVGLFESNYHMSINQRAGIYPLPILHHYDNIVAKLAQNLSYEKVLAQGAKNAAVAYQYGHNYNTFEDGIFRGNEDFAREYHQLFFGILGEYDHSYHELTAIPNTARALTDMQAYWRSEAEGGPDSEIVFGTQKHYSGDLDILKHTISGADASAKIDAIASVAINHQESLDNLPIMIIQHFADDNLSSQKIETIQESWAQMNQKSLLPFLWAYSVSSEFHNPTRYKYASSIERIMRIENLMIVDNDEHKYMLDYPGWELEEEGIRVFAPIHDVFGHQTGLEASDNANIFQINYNLSTRRPWTYTKSYYCEQDENYECKYQDDNGVDIGLWEKNWKDKIPADSEGKYKVEDVALWLWNHFIGDGAKHYGVLERAHIIALLNGKDLALFLDENDPLRVYTEAELESDNAILSLLHDASIALMDLDSSDIELRRDADSRVGLAIAFIVTTPYIYLEEGR